MPRPFFRVLQGQTDVTARAGDRNVSLTVTDGVGLDADTVSLVIDDMWGVVSPPSTGVDLRVFGGYENDFRDFGLFTVDEVTLDGWPQRITIQAQAASAKSEFKQERTEAYQPPAFRTYGDLADAVARRAGLALAASPTFRSLPLEYEGQAEESDDEFISRLGDRLGFTVSIKDRRMVIVGKGLGLSSSGAVLPIVPVQFGVNVVSYGVTLRDKPKHANVQASYFDRQSSQRRTVVVPASRDGPDRLIRNPYQSEQEAREAARAEAEKIRRAEGGANFVIDGNPHARAEAIAVVSGIRTLVDGRWRVTTVTHAWSADGPFTTTMDCEATGTEP